MSFIKLVLPVTLGVSALLWSALLSDDAGALPHGTTSSQGIVYPRGSDLYATSLDGRTTIRLTKTPGVKEVSPAVSPDGRRIAFGRYRAGRGEIWTMNVDGTDASRLPLSGDNSDPAWAPDGRTLFFVRSSKDDEDQSCSSIYRISIDGGTPEEVTRPSIVTDAGPAVSPDGSRVLYWTGDCSPGNCCSIAVMTTTGEPTDDLSKLPDTLGEGFGRVSWSPNGKRVAFPSETDADNVYVANLDGSRVKQVTPDRLWATDPAWSRDGRQLAVLSFVRRSQYDIFLIRPDGTHLRQLTRTRADESSPDWLPRMPAR